MLGGQFSFLLSKWIITTFNVPEKIVILISFILIFVAVMLLVFILARLLTKVTKAISLGWLNYLGGVLIGGLKFLLIIGIVLQIIVSNDRNEIYISASTKQKSVLLMPTIKITEFFTPYIKKALFNKDTNIDLIKE
jgi:membrane protein required for colicin V production